MLPELPAGKAVEFLLGVVNSGDRDFVLDAAEASFRSVLMIRGRGIGRNTLYHSHSYRPIDMVYKLVFSDYSAETSYMSQVSY